MAVCGISGIETDELFECGACGILFADGYGNSIRLLCDNCAEFADASRLEELEED